MYGAPHASVHQPTRPPHPAAAHTSEDGSKRRRVQPPCAAANNTAALPSPTRPPQASASAHEQRAEESDGRRRDGGAEEQTEQPAAAASERDEMGLGVWQTVQPTEERSEVGEDRQPAAERQLGALQPSSASQSLHRDVRLSSRQQEGVQQERTDEAAVLSVVPSSALYSALLASVSSSSLAVQQSSPLTASTAQRAGQNLFRKRRTKNGADIQAEPAIQK